MERRTRASCTLPLGPITASMITTPCTRADCAIGGYCGLTCLVLVGCLITPPTRTGCAGGGGGGGGASGSPPTTPPTTPPGTPPSTPPGTPSTPVLTTDVSGLISA